MACGTESAASPVPPLSDWEKLARAVIRSGEAKQSRRDIIPASVFMREADPELSTDRTTRMTDEQAVEQGQIIAKAAGPDRNFYGWAEISVPRVKDVNLTAVKSPIPGHKWHADILFPADAVAEPAKHTQLAGELARRADWRERPTESS